MKRHLTRSLVTHLGLVALCGAMWPALPSQQPSVAGIVFAQRFQDITLPRNHHPGADGPDNFIPYGAGGRHLHGHRV